MKLTITLNFRDDDGMPVGEVIDVPAEGIRVEPFVAPPRIALPKPKPWWRPSALDLMVFSGALAGALWLLGGL